MPRIMARSPRSRAIKASLGWPFKRASAALRMNSAPSRHSAGLWLLAIDEFANAIVNAVKTQRPAIFMRPMSPGQSRVEATLACSCSGLRMREPARPSPGS